MNDTLLTPAGYEKLTAEIEQLTTEGRRDVAERIKIARGYGDISENAEYDAAKTEQARLEQRIAVLEEKLRTARVVEEVDTKTVGLGNLVILVNLDDKDEEKYELVGTVEADPLANRVSIESPVGQALMGRKRGDEVEIETPGGKLRYKIKGIRIAK